MPGSTGRLSHAAQRIDRCFPRNRRDRVRKEPAAVVELEGGVFGFSRNDVRDPGDIGTPFSIQLLNADGPAAYFRIYVDVSPSGGTRSGSCLRRFRSPAPARSTRVRSSKTARSRRAYRPG
jgi:hypothetical protein